MLTCTQDMYCMVCFLYASLKMALEIIQPLFYFRARKLGSNKILLIFYKIDFKNLIWQTK